LQNNMISVYSFQFYLEINSLNDLKKLNTRDWASGPTPKN
jgi:hypothetical protein